MNHKSGNIVIKVFLVLLTVSLLYLIGTAAFEQLVVVNHYLFKKDKPSKDRSTSRQVTIIGKAQTSDLAVPSDWKSFKSDALGVSFRYPEIWGEIEIEPREPITKLSTLIKGFEGTGNLYNDSIAIEFTNDDPNSLAPRIEIFNKNHKGDDYPNAQVIGKGFIDNFEDLTINQDICLYTINYDHRPEWEHTYREFYRQCSQGVKTAVTESIEVFDRHLYSYDIDNYAYKKLENGYFDELLANQVIARVRQNRKRIDEFPEFLKQAELSEEKLASDIETFKIFANSIKSYKPVRPTPPPEKVPSSDDPNIQAIINYYRDLTANKLDGAYGRFKTKPANLTTFKSWYQDAFYAHPYDFVRIGDGRYKFFVEYQDNNTPVDLYRVIMDVDGQKLTTVSSEEFIGEAVKSKGLSAFVKQQKGKNYIVLVKDGNEEIIKEGLAERGNVQSDFFRVASFTPNGRYLQYNTYGWEWSSSSLYDTVLKKDALTLESLYFSKITPDGKYLAVCTSDHFGGAKYAKVYSIEGELKELFDISKNADIENVFDVFCEYDQSANALVITFQDFDGKVLNKHSYHIGNGAFTKLQ